MVQRKALPSLASDYSGEDGSLFFIERLGKYHEKDFNRRGLVVCQRLAPHRTHRGAAAGRRARAVSPRRRRRRVLRFGQRLLRHRRDHPRAECGSGITFQKSRQLFLLISRLEPELREYLSSHPEWRKNAAAFTKRFLDEGLRDRAITRDLDWGIPLPKEGWEKKYIYIWAENVLGYLSCSARLCALRVTSFAELWGSGARHYYVHGKDNIPFHTIILPSLLLAEGEGLHLPFSRI